VQAKTTADIDARNHRAPEDLTVVALRERFERIGTWLPFRVLIALAILAFHLAMMNRLGHDRFDYKFNESPHRAPLFSDPKTELTPGGWDRLVVSRWDAQHYIALGLRGLATCESKDRLAPGHFPDDDKTCELDFYPTYGWLGAAVAAITHAPMDYALLGISLVASFVFILMWTGRAMVEGLGVANAYLSLLLLNLFSSGYALVTVQTEPCVMALTLGSFVCLRKRWLFLGALLAGAATAIRISGVATGFAFCAALLVHTLREHPRPTPVWAWRGALMALSGWGIMTLMMYFWARFGDPLIYSHAHGRAYHHGPGIMRIFFPDGRLLMQSIWAEPHEGVILASALLWFALGHRKGLSGFHIEGQAYWYVLYFAIVGISMVGSADYGYGGNSRYMLTVLPLFFAIASITRRKPVALVIWLYMSTAHYYNGNMCMYVGQNHAQRLQRCGFARYFRSDELARGAQ
jgi:hypothetical protein